MPTKKTKSKPNQSNTKLRTIRAKAASTLVTGVFFVLAGGLIWQASSLIAQRANAVAPPEPTEAVTVRTGQITLQDHYTVSRSFTGQIEAPQTVNIAFETAGTVSDVLFDEGDRVEKDQVLARLDDRLLKADLERLEASKNALEAQRELAILTNNRQAELRQKGFASNQVADQSRLRVSEMEARIAEINAAILAAEIRLEKATVKAPFAGQVDQRLIDPGTATGNGQAVLSFVEDAVPVFRVGIAPDLAETLVVGAPVEVRLNDKTVPARVIAILPKIDPITRTRVVRAVLEEPAGLAFGQTGQLVMQERVDQSGAWIPLTAIEDGVRGLWTIKTAVGETETQVGIEAIEILHTNEEQAFVKGTFEPGSRIILDGLHRVAPGQRVRTEDRS